MTQGGKLSYADSAPVTYFVDCFIMGLSMRIVAAPERILG